MSSRSWFFASAGKQQGPYPEEQFRELIAEGVVRPDTLVWTEGMAGWQKAAEIPGLLSGAAGRPVSARAPGVAGGALSIDLPLWSFFGYCVLLFIGNVVVIPAPWTVTAYYRWLTPRIHVPGRPGLNFTGQVGDIWWVIIALALSGFLGIADQRLQLIAVPLQAVFSWLLIRWFVSHISSNGQLLPITFSGSVWGYIGFQLLAMISFITIIGWAWVVMFWIRWLCRNVAGTRREIVFNGSGLQILWRTLAAAIGCAFLIPIPWVLRWYTRWFVSQFALAERGAHAHA